MNPLEHNMSDTPDVRNRDAFLTRLSTRMLQLAKLEYVNETMTLSSLLPVFPVNEDNTAGSADSNTVDRMGIHLLDVVVDFKYLHDAARECIALVNDKLAREGNSSQRRTFTVEVTQHTMTTHTGHLQTTSSLRVRRFN